MGVTDSHFTTKLINPGQTQNVPNDFTSSSPDKKALMFIPFNGRFVLFAQGSESYTTQKAESFGFRPLKNMEGQKCYWSIFQLQVSPMFPRRSRQRKAISDILNLAWNYLKVELKCTQNIPSYKFIRQK